MLARLGCTRSVVARTVAACSPGLSQVPAPVRCFAAADKSGGGSGFVRTEAGLQDLYMRALEPKPAPVPKMSPEELEKNKEMAILYSKLRKKRHVRMERDMKRKLDLKWAAFHCLPSVERKKEALQINPFVPLYRKVATAFPPIHGFGGRPDSGSPGAGAEGSDASVAAGSSADSGAAAPASASGAAAGKGAAGGGAATAAAGGKPAPEAPKKPVNVNAESLLSRRPGRGSDEADLLGMSGAPPAAPATSSGKDAAPAPAAAAAGKKKKK